LLHARQATPSAKAAAHQREANMVHILQLLDGGMLHWNPWQVIAYTLLTTHLTIVAVTVYLHRSQAHHALELHPAVSHLFRFWLWIATGMITREWVAVHRKHHAHCEKEGDPHSPQVFGIGQVLLRGAELYRSEARCAATLQRYGAGTPDDWLERHVYSRYPWQGVGLLLVADVLMFGAIGASVWGVQMLWIPVCAAGVVNGLGHFAGYRNFDGPTAATNILPLGLLIGGEELHNNHHTYPTSARLSVRWFEIDVGWWYIRLLKAFGLAKVCAMAPRPPAGSCDLPLSAKTVAGVVVYRHHLMRSYGIMMVRTLRVELRQGRAADYGARWRRQAERLLRREPAYLSEAERSALVPVLNEHQWLAPLQRMRVELTELWERKLATPQELLAHLVDWCDRAERSGIPALRKFASELRSYG
jgi:stearoyl-CoA desaturase (delta-9 desaturase)